MKTLKPDGRIDLEHRAYFLRGSTESSAIVAASEDGHVSLVDFGSNFAMTKRPTTNLRAISPHPTESLLAFVDGKTGALLVRTLTDELVADFEPPSLADGASKSGTQGFADCYFDEGGDFLVDTKKLQIEEEVAIEGHEPRPISEYYPRLAKEKALGTDITWFTKLGSVIVFVFRRDRGTELKGWKDSLLWYSMKR